MLSAKTLKYRGIDKLDKKEFEINDKGTIRLNELYENKPISHVVVEIRPESDVDVLISYFKDENQTTKYFVETHKIYKNTIGYIVINVTYNISLDIVGKCKIIIKTLRSNII